MIRLRMLSFVLQAMFLLCCLPALAVLPKHGVYHQGRLDQCAKHTASRATKKSRHHRLAHGLKHLLRRPSVLHRATAHYAYPSDFFMWGAPAELQKPLAEGEVQTAKEQFHQGEADQYSPVQLVQAGAFVDEPLRGGIFNRREEVKNIILHSTETVHPADAPRVIRSWNRGLRHPGAQYIVDRDGTIYQTVDPKYGTVHVDVLRTLMGINNDNSIGIEMVRSGSQEYTAMQLDSVTHLVVYLQGRFDVANDHIYGHGQIQPSDRQDPVDFNWTAFQAAKSGLQNQAVAFQHHTHSAVIQQASAAAEPGTSSSTEVHMPTFVESECGVP